MVADVLVRPEDSVMLLTENGKLVRTPVADIRVCGRSTQGVTLIDIKNDKLVRLSRVAEDDAESEEGSQAASEGENKGPKK